VNRHDRRQRESFHHHDGDKRRRLALFQRLGIFTIGAMAFGLGLITVLKAPLLHYRNWWGDPVFAPFAILLGVAAMLWAFRRYDSVPPQ